MFIFFYNFHTTSVWNQVIKMFLTFNWSLNKKTNTLAASTDIFFHFTSSEAQLMRTIDQQTFLQQWVACFFGISWQIREIRAQELVPSVKY